MNWFRVIPFSAAFVSVILTSLVFAQEKNYLLRDRSNSLVNNWEDIYLFTLNDSYQLPWELYIYAPITYKVLKENYIETHPKLYKLEEHSVLWEKKWWIQLKPIPIEHKPDVYELLYGNGFDMELISCLRPKVHYIHFYDIHHRLLHRY